MYDNLCGSEMCRIINLCGSEICRIIYVGVKCVG